MNSATSSVFALFLIISSFEAIQAQEKQRANSNVIPLIEFRSVSLGEAIRNLAKQEGSNYIFDPAFDGFFIERDGKKVAAPFITLRRENVAARQALMELLKEHELELIPNAETGVNRISPTGLARKPFDASLIGEGNGETVQLLVMEGAPLDEALRQISSRGGLKTEIELKPTVPKPGVPPRFPPTVSFRWESITPKQALSALGENYGLELMKDAVSGAIRIRYRE